MGAEERGRQLVQTVLRAVTQLPAGRPDGELDLRGQPLRGIAVNRCENGAYRIGELTAERVLELRVATDGKQIGPDFERATYEVMET